MRFLQVFVLFTALAPVAVGFGADWPQFQGPNRDGKSAETGIARSWPAEGPKVLWRVALGEGFAGPSVVDGQVFILDREENTRDILRCIDLASGKELWTFDYPAPGRLGPDGSRATPTVDEKRIYFAGPFGQFHCLDRQTHEVLWKADLVKDFGSKAHPGWGVTQSPVLHKDFVIVAPQGPDAGVAAFDQASGKVVWKSPPLSGRASYASPILTTLCGVDQVVMVSAQSGKGSDATPGEVAGFDAANGRKLWSFGGWQCVIPIPYPTPLGQDRLLITGDYGAGTTAIRVKREGEAYGAEELFHVDVCDGLAHEPILYDGHIYTNGSGKAEKDRNGLLCMTLEGKVLWRTSETVPDLPDFEYGSVLFADGVLFVIDGANGDLRMVEASPEGYKELAKASLLSGKEVWAAMALSDGKLLIRDQTQMKCIDVRNP